MYQTIERPPRTIMELYKMLPEGTLAEVIDGKIYMSPSPVTIHQRIVLKLSSKLSDFVEAQHLGEIFVSPYDVYLDDHSNAVQPDIIFVSVGQSHIVKDHIYGVPDLLIELLSPGNQDHDKVTKRKLYEKFGVKEYWIIDPGTKVAVGYSLRQGSYQEFAKATGVVSSVVLNHSFEF